MCRAMEEMRNETVRERNIEIAKTMLAFSAARSGFKSPSWTSRISIRISPIIALACKKDEIMERCSWKKKAGEPMSENRTRPAPA